MIASVCHQNVASDVIVANERFARTRCVLTSVAGVRLPVVRLQQVLVQVLLTPATATKLFPHTECYCVSRLANGETNGANADPGSSCAFARCLVDVHFVWLAACSVHQTLVTPYVREETFADRVETNDS